MFCLNDIELRHQHFLVKQVLFFGIGTDLGYRTNDSVTKSYRSLWSVSITRCAINIRFTNSATFDLNIDVVVPKVLKRILKMFRLRIVVVINKAKGFNSFGIYHFIAFSINQYSTYFKIILQQILTLIYILNFRLC